VVFRLHRFPAWVVAEHWVAVDVEDEELELCVVSSTESEEVVQLGKQTEQAEYLVERFSH
jgi:hypothetical protein